MRGEREFGHHNATPKLILSQSGSLIKTNLGRHLENRDNEPADDSVFNKSIPQGAATQCYVAAHPIPAAITGQYFADCNLKRPSHYARDAELAKRLYEKTEEIVASLG